MEAEPVSPSSKIDKDSDHLYKTQLIELLTKVTDRGGSSGHGREGYRPKLTSRNVQKWSGDTKITAKQ